MSETLYCLYCCVRSETILTRTNPGKEDPPVETKYSQKGRIKNYREGK